MSYKILKKYEIIFDGNVRDGNRSCAIEEESSITDAVASAILRHNEKDDSNIFAIKRIIQPSIKIIYESCDGGDYVFDAKPDDTIGEAIAHFKKEYEDKGFGYIRYLCV